MCPDDSREDFRVLLDRWPSTFASVCLHRIEDEREVEESAWFSLSRALERGNGGSYEIEAATIAGEAALGYTMAVRRCLLTDWKLAHDGWLFVIGVLSVRDEHVHEEAVRRALDALDTWEWLSADSR
jgi:hypothetical protein